MAHLGLGVVSDLQGDINRAVSEYRTALDLDPNIADAHNNLGAILQCIGDQDGAIAEYRNAVQLDADDYAARFNLGFALLDSGAADNAVAEFRAALSRRSDLAILHYGLGRVLAAKGDLEGAAAEYRTALKLHSDTATYTSGAVFSLQGSAHLGLGEVLRKKEDIDSSLAEYHAVIGWGRKVGLVSGGSRYGPLIWESPGTFSPLIRSPLRTIHDALAHFGLGETLAARGDLKAALKEYSEAIKLDPDLELAKEKYDTLRSKLGDP